MFIAPEKNERLWLKSPQPLILSTSEKLHFNEKAVTYKNLFYDFSKMNNYKDNGMMDISLNSPGIGAKVLFKKTYICRLHLRILI